MIELDSPIQPYEWGSRSFLAQLQGRPVPSPTPEAELWLGAHPAAPSLASGTPLGDLIAAEPRHTLGEAVLDRFGVRLPYLLKLLAADAPLSIQVHPDAAQAREGFASRPRGGQAGAGYTDPYPKPELLVALTPFEALCGFRDPADSARELAELSVPALAPIVEALGDGEPGGRLRAAMSMLLDWPGEQRAELVGAVAATGHRLAVRLAKQYPGDPGVVVALLLNHLTLQPGEALYLPAGNVHAYLGGAGVEIMGASDNVMRAGLTVKPVDTAEVLRLVRYEVQADPRWRATVLGPGLSAWRPPVAEFDLVRAHGPVTLPGDGPRIVVCVHGVAQVRAGASAVALPSGRAAFVAASEPAVELTCDAEVFQAGVPAA